MGHRPDKRPVERDVETVHFAVLCLIGVHDTVAGGHGTGATSSKGQNECHTEQTGNNAMEEKSGQEYGSATGSNGAG
ncbi:hypothetical protein MACH21_00120 [Roseicyclus marinus]|uniref:Uncharacterized protein n=1 Tax=Roseicyclus marinus TaxID=2161673 RepID=A0AA48KJA0_9RHOB|nr:hypothetical protein MACH21_00120 [Roseicyclus marinus]